MAKELSEDGSEDSSDNLSDSQSRENNGGAITQEGRRGRWMRRGTVHCIHQSSCCDACGLPGHNTHNSSYPANLSTSKYRFPNTLKLMKLTKILFPASISQTFQ